MARVVERAQHAGHVAQRAVLGTALVERALRLALEVDEEEVVALISTCCRCRSPCRRVFWPAGGAAATASMRASSVGAAASTRSPAAPPARRAWRGPRQQRERAPALDGHRLRPGGDVGGLDRLGVEGRPAGAQREGEMQLRHAPGEQAHAFGHRLRVGGADGPDGLVAPGGEVARELLDRMGPCIALVRDLRLQQRHDPALAVAAAVLDAAGHRHAAA